MLTKTYLPLLLRHFVRKIKHKIYTKIKGKDIGSINFAYEKVNN